MVPLTVFVESFKAVPPVAAAYHLMAVPVTTRLPNLPSEQIV